jgi:hypothetical protein
METFSSFITRCSKIMARDEYLGSKNSRKMAKLMLQLCQENVWSPCREEIYSGNQAAPSTILARRGSLALCTEPDGSLYFINLDLIPVVEVSEEPAELIEV